jgi:hypothetical protein
MNTSGGDAMKTSIIYVCGAGLKKKKKKKKKKKILN